MFDISVPVLWVLGGGVVGAGILWLIQWYVSWKGTLGNKEAFVSSMIAALAEIAEKMYKGQGRGKEKLAWVLGSLLVFCEQRGITFDVEKMTELINQYVEQVINAAKETSAS